MNRCGLREPVFVVCSPRNPGGFGYGRTAMLQPSRHLLAACAAILATCLAASAQGATPGEVDATFGQNGRTVVAENSEAIGLRLPDGALLVASHVRDTRADVEL